MKVSVEIDVPDEVLAGILTAAVEGGIDYWARSSRYVWMNPKTGEELPFERWGVTVHQVDDEGCVVGEGKRITIAEIATGLQLLFQHKECAVAKASALQEITGNAGTMDAGDADVVMQLAVLGEVVYG